MPKTFADVDAVLESGLIGQVLWRVVAREGKSKNYADLLPLDGGTVGIAHFATGGLAALYREMDTSAYFARSEDEMISKYAGACRPHGKKGDDTGWGCYTQAWWHEGMQKFLQGPQSQEIQDKAWATMMKPVVTRAIGHGWNDERSIAIALGIANSLGNGGFTKIASKNNWDVETTLKSYVGTNAHRLRRQEAIDHHYPKG